jgi:hypothetical protein
MRPTTHGIYAVYSVCRSVVRVISIQRPITLVPVAHHAEAHKAAVR